MKKTLRYLLPVLLLAGSCKKSSDDLIQGKTADERLSAVMAAYQAKLTAATDGWVLVESTTGSAINQGATTAGESATFAYYMQFTDSNQVTMFSDFDSTMSVVPKTSSYRLKAVQRPALIFDTYSYIHVPCDPDPQISKSPYGPGLGWGADFEFSFADNIDPSAIGDTIHLKGNLNNTNAILVKATKAQHDAYYGGQVAQALFFKSIQTYFKRLTVGSVTFEFTPSLDQKAVDISWVNATGHIEKVFTQYYQLADAVYFVTPAVDGNVTLSSVDNIVFNSITGNATATVNSNAATIKPAIAPILITESQPSTWYTTAYNAQSLYVSSGGFHINGVDDAYGVQGLSFNGIPFYAYVYYPGAYQGYDVFSPFFANAATGAYPDYLPIAQGGENNGIAFFDVATLGPTPDPVTNTNNLMVDLSGYYFILKEDGTTYDMVSAADAKAWITWFYLN